MRYRLNPRHPAAHLFEVALEIDAPDPAARLPREDATPLHVSRGDRLVELGVTPAAPPADTACLAWVAEPGAEAVALRDAWLGAAA